MITLGGNIKHRLKGMLGCGGDFHIISLLLSAFILINYLRSKPFFMQAFREYYLIRVIATKFK